MAQVLPNELLRQKGDSESGPLIIPAETGNLSDSPDVLALIENFRFRAEAFVILGGGVSGVSKSKKKQLLNMFRCLDELVAVGLRFAVVDGGIRAGIMEAAGLARRRSYGAFLLLGVVPAPEITSTGREGKIQIDPNHSHILSVSDPGWAETQRDRGWEPSWGYRGSETKAKYDVFERMTEGRPSVAVIANGGEIALDEVERNIRQNRKAIVIDGSGRAADAIASALKGTEAPDDESAKLMSKTGSISVVDNQNLFRIVSLDAGPKTLTRVLREQLVPGASLLQPNRAPSMNGE
jgi:hypothetical protein